LAKKPKKKKNQGDGGETGWRRSNEGESEKVERKLK